MPIHVVTPDLVDSYASVLADMHLMRTRVFRDRMRWDVTCVNGLEIDQFDSMAPTYILYLSEKGAVEGCWRLLPTTGETMIGSVFSNLLDGQDFPRGPFIWECSRFAVDCPLDEDGGLYAVSAVTAQLFAGLISFGLENQINEIITVYDIRIAKLLKRIGCAPKWQSKSHRIGNTISIAGRFDVTQEVLAEVCTRAEIARPEIATMPALPLKRAA